jgi:hypothetical protein
MTHPTPSAEPLRDEQLASLSGGLSLPAAQPLALLRRGSCPACTSGKIRLSSFKDQFTTLGQVTINTRTF